MSRLAAGGLGLIAAAAVCLIGTLVDSAFAGVAWSLGAWLAVVAAATAYRSMAKTLRRTLPASALALLGVVASAWTIETTLRIAFQESNARRVAVGDGWWRDLVGVSPVPLLLLAVAGSSTGLAMLAWAARRASLVPPAVGVIVAVAAMLGSITADPAVPYVLGAGPLGAALLSAAVRTRISVRGRASGRGSTAGPSADRADRIVERAPARRERMSRSAIAGAHGATTAYAWAG
jgi:hypothetical protein